LHGAGETAECRSDGKGEQRLAPDLQPEAFRADRVFAQGLERAAPGRAQDPPHDAGGDQEADQREIVEGEVAVRGDPEKGWTWHADKAERAAGDFLFIAQDEEE